MKLNTHTHTLRSLQSINSIASAVMQMFLFDHVCRPFRNHYRWCICIARHNIRHNAGVHNSQIVDSIHLQSRINHSHRIVIRSHLTGPHGMVNSLRIVSCYTPVKVIAEHVQPSTARYCDVRHRCIDRLQYFRASKGLNKLRAFDLKIEKSVKNKAK